MQMEFPMHVMQHVMAGYLILKVTLITAILVLAGPKRYSHADAVESSRAHAPRWCSSYPHHPAGPESHLLPHVRPVIVAPAVLADGNSDARDGACDDRLPALQGHPDDRHPRSGWPHATPYLQTQCIAVVFIFPITILLGSLCLLLGQMVASLLIYG